MALLKSETNKAELRKHLKNQNRRNNLSQNLKNTKANSKTKLVFDSTLFNSRFVSLYEKSKILFIFLSLPDEIDTLSFVKKALIDNKKIAIPKIHDNKMSFYFLDPETPLEKQITIGSFGIFEPKNDLEKADEKTLSKNDIVFFPGLAFTKDGKRLGRGKGFYDRFFSTLWHTNNRPIFIGLCYESQIIDEIPTNEKDIMMDAILTEKSFY